MYRMTSYRCRLYFTPLSGILAGVTEYHFKVEPTVCYRFHYSAFYQIASHENTHGIGLKKKTDPIHLESIYLAVSSMI